MKQFTVYSSQFTVKATVAILMLLITISYLLPTTHAHILQSSGSVGAVLHIDPEDDPIAKEESTGFLEFKDKENKFTLNNCNCQLIISGNGKEILNQPLTATDPNSNSAIFKVTFPNKNIYQMRLIGQPKEVGQFPNFDLKYDIRVAREANTSVPQSNSWAQRYLIYLIAGGILLVFLISYLIKRLRQ